MGGGWVENLFDYLEEMFVSSMYYILTLILETASI